MTNLLVLLSALALLTALAIHPYVVAHIVRPKDEPRGLVVGRVVIVNIKGGLRAIAGVLTAIYDDSIVLSNARTLPGREKVLGEAVVPRDQIDWLQSDVPASILEDVTS